MNVDWVLPQKPVTGEPVVAAPTTTDHNHLQQRLNSALMLLTDVPIQPLDRIWVNRLGRLLQLKELVTRNVLSCVAECRSLYVQVSEQLPVSSLYELLAVSCLLALNNYQYPQVVVVVKEDKHLQELVSFLRKEYGFEKQPLNCLTLQHPVVFCLHSKFAELKLDMEAYSLLMLLGGFSDQELKKYTALKRNIIAVVTDDNKEPKTPVFSCSVFKQPARLIREFESHFDLHDEPNTIVFEQSEKQLFMVLLVLQRRKAEKIVVFCSSSALGRLSGFINANFTNIKVEDRDAHMEFVTAGWHVLSYGTSLQLTSTSCKRLIIFQNDLSIQSNPNISIQQSTDSQYNPISFFHTDAIQEPILSPPPPIITAFSKKHQPPPVLPATRLTLPLTMVQLQYNRTWVRLMTERNLQVYPPIVVMHIDYAKQSSFSINSLAPEKRNESVIYHSDKIGPIRKSAIIRSQLTQEIFDSIMDRISRNRQKQRDTNSMAFCQCPPINGVKLLHLINTCQQLNQRDPLQLILILFEDTQRFVDCLSNMLTRS